MKSVHENIDFTFPDIAHFWVWVEKGPDCWTWQGNLNDSGYGRITVQGKRLFTHRVSWQIAHGPIPQGAVVDHKCFNTSCVRPDHLRVASQKQNMEHRQGVRASSGFRGVYRAGKKWRGCVTHHRVKHYTESFVTPEEANVATVNLRNKFFTHNLLDRMV